MRTASKCGVGTGSVAPGASMRCFQAEERRFCAKLSGLLARFLCGEEKIHSIRIFVKNRLSAEGAELAHRTSAS